MATKKAEEASPQAEVLAVEPETDLWFQHTFGKPWEGTQTTRYVHYVLISNCAECGIPVYANHNMPWKATEGLAKFDAGLAHYEPQSGNWYCQEHAPLDKPCYETIGNCAHCGQMTLVARTDRKNPPCTDDEQKRLIGNQQAILYRTAKGEPPMCVCGNCEAYPVAPKAVDLGLEQAQISSLMQQLSQHFPGGAKMGDAPGAQALRR